MFKVGHASKKRKKFKRFKTFYCDIMPPTLLVKDISVMVTIKMRLRLHTEDACVTCYELLTCHFPVMKVGII